MTKCAVETCQLEAAPGRRGWCSAHYQKWWKYGDANTSRKPLSNSGKCTANGCNKPPRSRTSPYCEMHYGRLRRTGTTETTVNMEPSATCLHCRATLGANRVGEKFCSSRCSARYYRSRPLQIDCPVCGKPFIPISGAEVCSAECRTLGDAQAFRAWRIRHQDDPAYQDRIRKASHKRRIQKFKTAADNFNDSDIFKRDGWICALCHKPVNPETRWPDPQAPSLDHVIPLSRGGRHAPDNVQLAHLRCNLKKSNKTIYP